MTYRIREVTWFEPKRPWPYSPAHQRNYKPVKVTTYRISLNGVYVDSCLSLAAAQRTVRRLTSALPDVSAGINGSGADG